jgi:sec-independent protein translocase protein TatA
MPNLGGWEWVILAVVALLLFGGARLAGVGKSAGQAIRQFKEEVGKKDEPTEADAEKPLE